MSKKNFKDMVARTISNEALYERTNQELTEHQIRRKKWSWIGTTHNETGANMEPSGQKEKGNTLRREVKSSIQMERAGSPSPCLVEVERSC